MRIQSVEIDLVIPYDNNPRDNVAAIEKVAASINEFGWQQPIVVDENMVVIVGHTRLLAAKKLEMKLVPIQIAENLTAEQVKAYRLADNRTNEEASWNMKMLGSEIKELDDLGVDLMLTGFSDHELSNLLIDPELLESEPKYDESLMAHKLDVFQNNTIKQIVLYYDIDKYKEIYAKLENAGQEFGMENNSEIVEALINFYEAGRS
jgi:ParB-like chromosome segregation protein Spo0J